MKDLDVLRAAIEALERDLEDSRRSDGSREASGKGKGDVRRKDSGDGR